MRPEPRPFGAARCTKPPSAMARMRASHGGDIRRVARGGKPVANGGTDFAAYDRSVPLDQQHDPRMGRNCLIEPSIQSIQSIQSIISRVQAVVVQVDSDIRLRPAARQFTIPARIERRTRPRRGFTLGQLRNGIRRQVYTGRWFRANWCFLVVTAIERLAMPLAIARASSPAPRKGSTRSSATVSPVRSARARIEAPEGYGGAYRQQSVDIERCYGPSGANALLQRVGSGGCSRSDRRRSGIGCRCLRRRGIPLPESRE